MTIQNFGYARTYFRYPSSDLSIQPINLVSSVFLFIKVNPIRICDSGSFELLYPAGSHFYNSFRLQT